MPTRTRKVDLHRLTRVLFRQHAACSVHVFICWNHQMRRIIGLIIPVVSLLTAVAYAQTTQTDETAKEKRWTCALTTEGVQLIWSKYSGGGWADIHIAPYGRPGSYKVARDGDLAKGKTSNGTEFVCKLA